MMTDEVIQMITVWSAIGLVINVEADEIKTYLFVFRGLRKMQNNPFTKGKKKHNMKAHLKHRREKT